MFVACGQKRLRAVVVLRKQAVTEEKFDLLLSTRIVEIVQRVGIALET